MAEQTLMEELSALIKKIDDIDERAGSSGDLSFEMETQEERKLLLHASRAVLSAMASTTMGECRVTTPFAPLRPIIDEDGNFKWCCTHTPPHCS